MEALDYEGIFSREAHAIITTALHEHGIDAITEEEYEHMVRGLRAEYLRCNGEFRRAFKMSVVPRMRFW